MTKEELKTTVLGVLRPHLGPTTLVDIEIEEDVDSDGDEVLRMRVVYDESTGELSDLRVYQAPGLVIEALEEVSEDRFPLMTFVSKEDSEAAA